MAFEYRAVPAPTKGRKAKGVKGAEARFAHAMEHLLNEMAGEGWEYLRADTLASEERAGLASTVTQWRTLLIFRRPAGATGAAEADEAPEAEALAVEDARRLPHPDRVQPEAPAERGAGAPQEVAGERPGDAPANATRPKESPAEARPPEARDASAAAQAEGVDEASGAEERAEPGKARDAKD